ncbi:uncharacterized protein CG1161-like [Panonychus citri]|uniref:uncharacterized protein CG1161-like n=1 Tax=Panonychus citri TaxID=50023 RepID=UPI0023076A3E|nr:uncharacterized protein CG1161-like [Panonychus citri]
MESIFFLFLCLFVGSSVGQYENERCKCVCPSLRVVANDSLPVRQSTAQGNQSKSNNSNNNKDVTSYNSDVMDSNTYNNFYIDRKVYIDSVPPLKCNCDGLVLPQLSNVSSKEFCPLCECRFESRNTEIIRYTIIGVITVVMLLVAYMLILILDSYMLWSKIFRRMPYREHFNEEMLVETGPKRSSTESIESTSQPELSYTQSKSVIGVIGHEQHKWIRKVSEQRKNIYDRHTMLN